MLACTWMRECGVLNACCTHSPALAYHLLGLPHQSLPALRHHLLRLVLHLLLRLLRELEQRLLHLLLHQLLQGLLLLQLLCLLLLLGLPMMGMVRQSSSRILCTTRPWAVPSSWGDARAHESTRKPLPC